MKVAIVMNAGAGSIGRERCEQCMGEILAACAEAGLEATVALCEPEHVAATTRAVARSGVDCVIAAGGDGTVSTVAAGLVGGDVPLAVLPLGTLNHFARDLGVPAELGRAARAIATGRVARIDVGDLDGRTFVNNSSIGLYPEIVIQRDEDRRVTGRSKARAMLVACARVLRRFPLLHVRIGTDRGVLRAQTPFVFVGNNVYSIDILRLGRRRALDRGELCLYMIRSTTRARMFWLMVRASLQRLRAVKDFEAHLVREAVVYTGRHHLEVALDGEVVRMTPPLHYRIRPRALPVIVPPPELATRVDDRVDDLADDRADERDRDDAGRVDGAASA